MRVPVSWLREYVELPADVTARGLAAELIAAGLEVETVDEVGADISGPIVVGRVLEIEELTGFKKPIRHCRLDVGSANGTASRRTSSAVPATSPRATSSSWRCPAPSCPAGSRSAPGRPTAGCRRA